MTRWWTWPALLVIYAAITYTTALLARGEDSGPRKIVASVVQPKETDTKKRVLEQFKYPGTFEDEASCQKLLGSPEFAQAVGDLKLAVLGKDTHGLEVETACVPVDQAPVHP